MNEQKWQFPISSSGEIKGISSADEETFKEFPYKSFTRELLQNSIDAKDSDEKPVCIEFSKFSIDKNDIPGLDNYISALKRCKEFWCNSGKPDCVAVYQEMIDYIEKNTKISCLRISDFNTTGLQKIDSDDLEGNNYLALIKGVGFSSKKGNVTGGSKGVGKNATFLLSKLKMIFYSTKTKNEDGCVEGFVGVGKLATGYVSDDATEKDRKFTQGTGYYSIGDGCKAILKPLLLDKNNISRKDEYGTDIYVIGFKEDKDWEEEVLKEILSSFMVAINNNKLEIHLNNHIINSSTLDEIINSELIKGDKSIVAQYEILNSDETKNFDIETEYGNCALRIKTYKQKDINKATNKCYMIRFPGMFIKSLKHSDLGFSAMCIINDDRLGKSLLDIENPQHNNWEPNRLNDNSLKNEMRNLIKEIESKIRKHILDVFKSAESLPIDPLGAGEFLPDSDYGESSSENKKEKAENDEITTTKFKENKVFEKNMREKDNKGNGLEPFLGAIEEDGDSIQAPLGKNDSSGGNSHPGNDPTGSKEGENILFKNAQLKGTRYKVISLNKGEGIVKIVFYSPITHNECFLVLEMLDDSNKSKNVNILNLKCNNEEIKIQNINEYGPFSINEKTKTLIEVKTDMNEYFGCGVKVICK